MSDKVKVLPLDSLNEVKNYINRFVNNQNEIVIKNFNNKFDEYDSTIKEFINDNINSAVNNLNDDYTEKYNYLEEQLKNATEIEVITAIKLKLEALTSDFNDKSDALKELSDIVNGIKDSTLSVGEINEIINAELINSVNFTDDMIEAPTIFSNKIISLIGRFGKIEAINIIGDEISGKTIKSDNDSWQLNNDGSGHLANGAISWDSDGEVSLNDVTINWNSIENAPDIEKEADYAVKTKLDEYSINSTLISGKTIQTNLKKSLITGTEFEEIDKNGNSITIISTGSTEGPAWQLRNNGEGYLACGNIKWDELGNVSFSESIETKVLNTKPGDNTTDKIQIQDNIIECVNNDGKTNLKISSNEVDTESVNTMMNNSTKINYLGSSKYYTFTKEHIDNILTNSDSFYIGKEPEINGFKLGYIRKGSTVTIDTSLSLTKNSLIENPLAPSVDIAINASDWKINKNTIILYLYKFNAEENIWNLIKDFKLNPSRLNDNDDWNNSDKLFENSNLFLNSIIYKNNSLTISENNFIEDGEYMFTYYILNNSFSINESYLTNNLSLLLNYRTKVKQNIQNYVEIGKNGILVYNNDAESLFSINDDGITLKVAANNDKYTTGFHGIKLTNDGIYISDYKSSVELNTWKRLDISQLPYTSGTIIEKNISNFSEKTYEIEE